MFCWALGVLLLVAHLAGCTHEETDGASGSPEPEPAPEPASEGEPEETETTTFFVELLHLPTYRFLASGVVDTADASPGSVEFALEAPSDAYLQCVFVPRPSDGTFIAFREEGLAPFEAGRLVQGDRGGELRRYVLGSEDAGEAVVRELPTGDTLGSVEFEPSDGEGFTLRALLNGSYLGAVYTLYRPNERMFSGGEVPSQEFARWVLDGDAQAYGRLLEEQSGFSSLVAPGLFVVHTGGEPLFTPGEVDRGEGLERLAEDGDPFPLLDVLEGTLDGVAPFPEAMEAYSDPNSAEKDSTSYAFSFDAVPGDRLSFAAMLAQTNDTFVGTAATGLSLFRDGEPVSADLTSALGLWEVGTEVNERAGYGQYQAARQTEPNSGPTESKPIADVSSSFPPVDRLMRLTITPVRR